MESANTYSFVRYLSAKKTVDDRALNKTVLESLRQAMASMEDLRVLEIGAGIGTMVERLVDWGVVSGGEYTAIDSEAENMCEAARRLPLWAKARGLEVAEDGPESLLIRGKRSQLRVNLVTADVLEFMARESNFGKWDLLVANAFLDLVDVPHALPSLFALLKPRGLFYFTITFDGGTILQPEIDPILDGQVEALYHETMDSRIIGGKPSGDSRTGRHFFGHARNSGAEILAAGSSDWVVFAGSDGYMSDETFFLRFIIRTMAGALSGHPKLDPVEFNRWIETRESQLDRCELVYIAHQMDFLGRVGR